ncbi:ARF GTPase-activating protein Git [Diabrotica virgifera virgifera]|uniref:ARF GTPase-activating protein GIT1 n=1 Tax=Diabrotica virgifera virgifera TaxID=50390 RepID=A0A6P7FTT5_DIAVI|nr:ARF GTPase-activating protein Git [Diabrotica virgifera virgifera]
MSRAKSKHNNMEICGDCGALEATWASVNKGILLCTQCCSIHRSLGRHISQVKSIPKSTWQPNQLNMVYALNNNGANNIWENALLENGGKLMKKKPNAKDPLSVKQEYIRQKHLQCTYAFRENYEDGLISVENELGKQLHASVRTPNLETSFRLLALGADPNYFHDEKGSTPLHVATKSDQKLQVELLLVYGADPSCPDSQGKTPIDYARALTNKDLINRLTDSQYEVTDTFSYYLSLRKPDHTNGIHFYIPQTGFKSNSQSLTKLQKLSNHVFEELAMDVYDEVDRRETEAIWLSCADTTDLNDVPFLPVDNTLSTTRNQGRQKLARFSTPELKSLVYDILVDTQRRQMVSDKSNISQLREVSTVDEDPLYDSVASDDDYAVIPDEESPRSDKPPTSNSDKDSIVSLDSISKTNKVLEQLTKQLKNSDNTITDLRAEVMKLRQCVKVLQTENTDLRSRLSEGKLTSRTNGDSGFDSLEFISEVQGSDETVSNGVSADEIDFRRSKRIQRPTSMYETREGIGKVPNWQAMKNQMKHGDARGTQSLYSSPQNRETILKCTEQITWTIQHLCKAIQEPDKEECVSSAEKVKVSVCRLASFLPKEQEADRLKLMVELVSRLHPECSALQTSNQNNDTKSLELHFGNIREIAFHLAKFTKDIVTKYSSNH